MGKSEDEEDTALPESIEIRNFQQLHVDAELFHEDDYVPAPMLQVKRIRLPKGSGENWQVRLDKTVVMTLPGIRFTKNEREFLRTVEGTVAILRHYKEGCRSVAKMKTAIKKDLAKVKKK